MAAATDRPAPDPRERPGPGFEPGTGFDALAGGPPDRYPDALRGDAAGGMIGGVDGEPLAADALAVDDPLGPVPAEGYRDVLSEAFPPAPAAEPATLPAAPPAPTGRDERGGRDGRGGRTRPARPAGNPRRRPVPEPPPRRRRRPGGPAGTEPATVRSVGPAPATQGTVPARLSPPAGDGSGIRWVRRAFILLVLGAIVFGNVAHGCASRLADQVDPTRPASVSR